jgi:rhodanese-related sulfurtransferase
MEEGRSFALLDVRPDSLFEAARIAGSIHAYGRDFESLRDVIPPEVDAPVVWVSEDGRRPLGAPDRAAEAAGYLRVLWLEGGLRAWVASGHPTVGSRLFPR